MREDEQKQKLKELEEKLESALERIEELEGEFSVEEEPDQQDSIHIESAEGAEFRVHWIDPSDVGYSCSGIDTVKKAQEVFADANAYKNSNGHRVMHGDVLVLMCNYEYGDACYYVGLCVVTNTPNQLSVPNSPDITEDSGNKEFMAWYTCPGENEGTCECDDGVSIPELGSTSEWVVEDDQCVRFTDLTNLEVYQSDSEGTDLKAYTREITLNKCGEIISISQESETVLNIPCCDGEETSTCEDGFLDVYTLTDADGVEFTLRRHPQKLGDGVAINCPTWYSEETFGEMEQNYWIMTYTDVGANQIEFAVTGNSEFDADWNPISGFPCLQGVGPKSDGNKQIPTGTYECLNNPNEPVGTIATVTAP